jgi:uncharacterized RDD family membrane protein YckC
MDSLIAVLLFFTIVLIIPYLAFLLYPASKGLSPGKSALGLRVVKMDGSPPGWGKALLREIVGKTVSSLPLGLGLLWMLWDPKRQGWHDKIAGTQVIMKL